MMLVMRFIHAENKLFVNEKVYKANCTVRNEVNGWRGDNEITNSMPIEGLPMAYQPRKFPTGLWMVKAPEHTDHPEFSPVKIPTTAHRAVLIWSVKEGEYIEPSGEIQEDYFYHLHYSANSNTTLGCIRLDTAEDALEIAKTVTLELSFGSVYLEVLAAR